MDRYQLQYILSRIHSRGKNLTLRLPHSDILVTSRWGKNPTFGEISPPWVGKYPHPGWENFPTVRMGKIPHPGWGKIPTPGGENSPPWVGKNPHPGWGKFPTPKKMCKNAKKAQKWKKRCFYCVFSGF